MPTQQDSPDARNGGDRSDVIELKTDRGKLVPRTIRISEEIERALEESAERDDIPFSTIASSILAEQIRCHLRTRVRFVVAEGIERVWRKRVPV